MERMKFSTENVECTVFDSTETAATGTCTLSWALGIDADAEDVALYPCPLAVTDLDLCCNPEDPFPEQIRYPAPQIPDGVEIVPFRISELVGKHACYPIRPSSVSLFLFENRIHAYF